MNASFALLLILLALIVAWFWTTSKPVTDPYVDEPYTPQPVPKKVWVFWFGQEMSAKRKQSLERMRATMGVPVVVITQDNIAPYLKWPVHPAVQHLSGIHKADYFRIYFLLHYGGGYSDVKPVAESWLPHFNEFDDPSVWVVGVPEIPGPGGVAVAPGKQYPPDYHTKMISNCFFIARPGNPFFKRVHERQHQILDRVYPVIRNTPYVGDRCCQDFKPGYPLRWAEILGELMADVAQRYHQHFARTMKMPDLSDYL